MSSSRPNVELLNLAPEILQNVIQQVGDPKDLSNARLACKTLDKHATKELFKDIENHGMFSHRECEEVGDNFRTAVAALSKFPNVDSIEIGFTPECLGVDAGWYQEVFETIDHRVEMLQLIFQAIKDRAANKENRTIRKLTIINLQNCPVPEFTSTQLFRDVMSDLTELHISITQEFNDGGPDHDYTKIELQVFPGHLCSDWLEPISATLRALSIYHASDNWGPFPGYFDPSGISFPKLETLALGYYTLAHDSDFDWILGIKSLRKLILHNCMILSWIRLETSNVEEWGMPKNDWTVLVDPDDPDDTVFQGFQYGGEWSQHLSRIPDELPNLVDFRFDKGSAWGYEGQPAYGVAHRNECGARISSARYVSFDNGILPSHWQEADDKSEGLMESWIGEGFPINVHEKSLKSDQKSLDELLERLRIRGGENRAPFAS